MSEILPGMVDQVWLEYLFYLALVGKVFEWRGQHETERVTLIRVEFDKKERRVNAWVKPTFTSMSLLVEWPASRQDVLVLVEDE